MAEPKLRCWQTHSSGRRAVRRHRSGNLSKPPEKNEPLAIAFLDAWRIVTCSPDRWSELGTSYGPHVTVTGTVTRTPAVSSAWAGRLTVTTAAEALAEATMSTPATVRATAARRNDPSISPSFW